MEQDLLKTSSEAFSQRKKDHINISLTEDSQSFVDQFSQIELQHKAIPEIDFSEVSIEAEVFGNKLQSPLFVSSMTLGHEGAQKLNSIIMGLCEKKGWMMGVGSQRRQLFDKHAYQECEELRSAYPNAVLFGNIGLTQIIDADLESIEGLVESLKAQFLVVHTNPLQEALQQEGTPFFRGGLKSLEKLCENLSVPVVLKETGCGFSVKDFSQLKKLKLAAIDVSGKGGTHWGKVEGLRQNPKEMGYKAAQSFSSWGISTVDSVLNGVESKLNTSLWASGGVRNGLDAAKLLVLGAEKVGFARPILQAAVEGEQSLEEVMNRLDFELKVAMFCMGIKNLKALVGKRKLYKWK